MDKKEFSIFNKASISTVILLLVLLVVLFFVTKNENGEIKSIIVGTLVSLILNYYHIRKTSSLMETSQNKLKGFTIFSYTFRYFIYGLLILLSWKFTSFNPVYIMFGIIIYPTIVLILTFTLVKGEK